MTKDLKVWLVVLFSGVFFSFITSNIWIGIGWCIWWVFIDLTGLYEL